MLRHIYPWFEPSFDVAMKIILYFSCINSTLKFNLGQCNQKWPIIWNCLQHRYLETSACTELILANFIPSLAQFSMLLNAKMCCFLSLSGKKRLKKTTESNSGTRNTACTELLLVEKYLPLTRPSLPCC